MLESGAQNGRPKHSDAMYKYSGRFSHAKEENSKWKRGKTPSRSQTKFRGQKSIDEDVLIKVMINQEALMARVLDLENKQV